MQPGRITQGLRIRDYLDPTNIQKNGLIVSLGLGQMFFSILGTGRDFRKKGLGFRVLGLEV